jgi:hypothetical protein
MSVDSINLYNFVVKNINIKETIGTLLKNNKTNDFLEFLVILNDKDYITGYFTKSYYQKLLEQKYYFPGELHIINEKELKNNNIKNYFIEGNVMLKKIYIKLPKENIYVDSNNFQEKYFNSKINELISIFSIMNVKKIELSFNSENTDDFKLNISSSIHTNIDIEAGVNNDINKHNNLIKKWKITFNNNKNQINIKDFTDKNKFYYLPKEAEWIEIIRKRVNRNMLTDNYVYSYSDTNNFNLKLFSNLKLLNIDLTYNNNKYNNIKIEYDVEYYPIVEISTCIKCGDNTHETKNCGKTNKNNEDENSFLNKLLNIIF